MITARRSMNKPLVIYHGNCQDGFTAAWAIWLKHPDWEFYPAKHGDPRPNVTGREVYMVDFSYKKDVVTAMAAVAESIVILDHHKTAEEDLKAMDQITTNVNVVFNMEKSGAHLAWEHFHSEPVPPIIQIVEDRDLWRFKFIDTKAISSYIFSQPYDFEMWSFLAHMLEDKHDREEIEGYGNAILQKQAKDTQELSANKFRTMIDGHSVWTVNLPYTFSSDMGNLLAKGEPFASTFYYDGEGFVYSLFVPMRTGLMYRRLPRNLAEAVTNMLLDSK